MGFVVPFVLFTMLLNDMALENFAYYDFFFWMNKIFFFCLLGQMSTLFIIVLMGSSNKTSSFEGPI
jgi:hypothetical protein